MTAVATGSFDSDEYIISIGGYGCTKDCKKVIWGTQSGWFDVVTGTGASNLVVAASFVIIAALI